MKLDTIPDNLEGACDPDDDNLPNFRDIDADGDGTNDQREGLSDSNNHGMADFFDPTVHGSATVNSIY